MMTGKSSEATAFDASEDSSLDVVVSHAGDCVPWAKVFAANLEKLGFTVRTELVHKRAEISSTAPAPASDIRIISPEALQLGGFLKPPKYARRKCELVFITEYDHPDSSNFRKESFPLASYDPGRYAQEVARLATKLSGKPVRAPHWTSDEIPAQFAVAVPSPIWELALVAEFVLRFSDLWSEYDGILKRDTRRRTRDTARKAAYAHLYSKKCHEAPFSCYRGSRDVDGLPRLFAGPRTSSRRCSGIQPGEFGLVLSTSTACLGLGVGFASAVVFAFNGDDVRVVSERWCYKKRGVTNQPEPTETTGSIRI